MPPTGKRIAAEWEGYKKCLHPDAGPTQISETRRAYYAGATALFSSIITMLDPGTEPTVGDLKKMDEIHAELLEVLELINQGVA